MHDANMKAYNCLKLHIADRRRPGLKSMHIRAAVAVGITRLFAGGGLVGR